MSKMSKYLSENIFSISTPQFVTWEPVNVPSTQYHWWIYVLTFPLITSVCNYKDLSLIFNVSNFVFESCDESDGNDVFMCVLGPMITVFSWLMEFTADLLSYFSVSIPPQGSLSTRSPHHAQLDHWLPTYRNCHSSGKTTDILNDQEVNIQFFTVIAKF